MRQKRIVRGLVAMVIFATVLLPAMIVIGGTVKAAKPRGLKGSPCDAPTACYEELSNPRRVGDTVTIHRDWFKDGQSLWESMKHLPGKPGWFEKGSSNKMICVGTAPDGRKVTVRYSVKGRDPMIQLPCCDGFQWECSMFPKEEKKIGCFGPTIPVPVDVSCPGPVPTSTPTPAPQSTPSPTATSTPAPECSPELPYWENETPPATARVGTFITIFIKEMPEYGCGCVATGVVDTELRIMPRELSQEPPTDEMFKAFQEKPESLGVTDGYGTGFAFGTAGWHQLAVVMELSCPAPIGVKKFRSVPQVTDVTN